MADVYMVPEATLVGAPPQNDIPLPRDFRSFDGNAITLAYETIIAVRRVQERQAALAMLAEVDPNIIPPQIEIHSLQDDPERLGRNYRLRLGFREIDQLRLAVGKAFTLWRMIIENLGVAVYIEPLGNDDTRGVSVMANQFPAIIIDQNEKHEGARIFTLLHEFAHVLIGQPGISNFNNKSSIEAFCNRFAASFILPRSVIEAVMTIPESGVVQPDISQLESAATRLCCTISQLALRLETLGIAPSGYFKNVAARLKPGTAKPKQKGGDWRYAYVSNVGYQLPTYVLASLDRESISRVEASRILEASPRNFPQVRRTINERRAELAEVA